MQESCPCGSVRGASGNRRPYRDTPEGEISGERTRKRRSAKHLELLPSLLEGRRSIQLSYGRNRIDSKTFVRRRDIVSMR
jgi:hypothetical protein